MPVLVFGEFFDVDRFGVLQNAQLFQEPTQLFAQLFCLERVKIMHPGGAVLLFADSNL